MSALVLENQPLRPIDHPAPHGLQMILAAVAGAAAPWLLLVTAYAGLARSATACFAGPLPI